MAIIGFNFSKEYKSDLLSGKKTATVLDGKCNIGNEYEILVFVASKNNFFKNGSQVTNIGKATISLQRTKPVKFLTKYEAKKCGYSTIIDLKKSLKKYYGAEKQSIVTYVEFDLECN